MELTQKAEKLGVDGVLLASPYYNKPTQEGVYRHYKKIAESTSLKLMLYNVPGRGRRNWSGDLCPFGQRMAEYRFDQRSRRLRERVSALRTILPPEFSILSGDDGLTLPFMAVGAVGVVSVVSNVIPKQITDMVNAFSAGSRRGAKNAPSIWPFFKDLFIESNPIPVKAAFI